MEPIRRILDRWRPRIAGRDAADASKEAQPEVDTYLQRFDPKDIVVLRKRGLPLARVGQVLGDGRLKVWILKIDGGPQRWEGPKTVRTTDVLKNFGPLDDVGIGAKIRDKM